MYSFQVYWYIFVNNYDSLSAHIHLYLHKLPNLNSVNTLPNSYKSDYYSRCCTLDYKVFPAHNSQFVYRSHSDPKIHLDTHIEILREGFGKVSRSSYEYQIGTHQYHHIFHQLAGIQENKGSEIPFGKTHNSHYRPSCSSEKLFENSINKDMNNTINCLQNINVQGIYSVFSVVFLPCPSLAHTFSVDVILTHTLFCSQMSSHREYFSHLSPVQKTSKTVENHCL